MNYAFEIQGERIVIYEIFEGHNVGDFYVAKKDAEKLISVLMSAVGEHIYPRHKSIKFVDDSELLDELKAR